MSQYAHDMKPRVLIRVLVDIILAYASHKPPGEFIPSQHGEVRQSYVRRFSGGSAYSHIW